jgi:hypothetical protein
MRRKSLCRRARKALHLRRQTTQILQNRLLLLMLQ